MKQKTLVQKASISVLGFLMGLSLLGLAPGEVAPNFTAFNQDGKTIQLSQFKNQFVLIYFYPKDDTPGCTREACSFRDQYSEIKAMKAVVLGVSAQGQSSHLDFKKKHHLPFDLLVDSDGDIAKVYGVGRIPLLGFHKRQSVLIGPNQRVVKFYSDVDPVNHVKEVLQDIQKFSDHSN